MGPMPGKIFTSLPLRPCAIAEFFTFWVNARVSSSDGEWVNTASAYLPASAIPSSDEPRSEEHTSELQSQSNLVCRLLLEKKKTIRPPTRSTRYTDNSRC